MPRIVTKTAKEPQEIKVGGESKWICMCGLSRTQPFCDGSHQKTLDEKDDKLYVYDEKGDRHDLKECEEDEKKNIDGGEKADKKCCGHCG